MDDKIVGETIANILSGGDTDITKELDEESILILESKAIQDLLKTDKTQERIEILLDTGKVFRN